VVCVVKWGCRLLCLAGRLVATLRFIVPRPPPPHRTRFPVPPEAPELAFLLLSSHRTIFTYRTHR
jgi:hypothetical protein